MGDALNEQESESDYSRRSCSPSVDVMHEKLSIATGKESQA